MPNVAGDTKFKAIFDAYKDVFGEIFPRMEYDGLTKEEHYEMMRNCIAQNKPAEVLYPIVEGAYY